MRALCLARCVSDVGHRRGVAGAQPFQQRRPEDSAARAHRMVAELLRQRQRHTRRRGEPPLGRSDARYGGALRLIRLGIAPERRFWRTAGAGATGAPRERGRLLAACERRRKQTRHERVGGGRSAQIRQGTRAHVQAEAASRASRVGAGAGVGRCHLRTLRLLDPSESGGGLEAVALLEEEEPLGRPLLGAPSPLGVRLRGQLPPGPRQHPGLQQRPATAEAMTVGRRTWRLRVVTKHVPRKSPRFRLRRRRLAAARGGGGGGARRLLHRRDADASRLGEDHSRVAR